MKIPSKKLKEVAQKTTAAAKKKPEKSLSSFVEGVARFLRTTAKEFSLKGRATKTKAETGAANKIEQIALFLRKQAHKASHKKNKH